MRTRSSALIMAGLSVLLVWGSACPQIAYAGTEDLDRATTLQDQHSEDKDRAWNAIIDAYCTGSIDPRENKNQAQERFSDAAVKEFDEAFRMSPMEFEKDPVVATRETTMVRATIKTMVGNRENRHEQEVDVDFAPPLGFTEADKLRLWLHLLCTSDIYKTEYRAGIKTYSEKYGLQMRPEYTDDAAILKLYDKKMVGELTALLHAKLIDEELFEKLKRTADED